MVEKIIDTHIHIIHTLAGWGSEGELRACSGGKATWSTGNTIQMIPPELGEYHVSPEAVLKLMDAHHVEKGVLLQGSYYGFQNEYVWDALQKYPDRFVGAATYDPFCLKKDAIRHHLFDEHGFRIVKFEVSPGSGMMSYHGYVDLFGDVMQEVYDYSDERGHLFVVDIGRKDDLSWQIESLRKAILAHPNMKFVVCHILAPRPCPTFGLIWLHCLPTSVRSRIHIPLHGNISRSPKKLLERTALCSVPTFLLQPAGIPISI